MTKIRFTLSLAEGWFGSHPLRIPPFVDDPYTYISLLTTSKSLYLESEHRILAHILFWILDFGFWILDFGLTFPTSLVRRALFE
jgi:hypothetical protein